MAPVPAPDGSAVPAGGPSDPRGHGRRRGRFGQVKGTPVQDTEDDRPSDLVTRLKSLVGVKICAITNMMTAPWGVHGIHLVTRRLLKLHPVINKCFVQNVGIVGDDGKLHINLDSTGNVELVHFGLHLWFDGQSVVGEAYGQGNWAFAPKHFREALAHIKANRGANYKELFPEGTHEYIMYGFPNDHKHVFGRYSDHKRTYSHSRNYTGGPKPSEAEVFAEFADAQYDDPTFHTIITGDQGFVIVSHLNPVFVIFDYTFKMKYHYDDPARRAHLPAEDVEFYEKELWPVVQQWFEKPKTTRKKPMKEAARKRSLAQDKATMSAPDAPVAPATPVQPRLAASAPANLATSPLTELSSDDPPQAADKESWEENAVFTDGGSTIPPSALARRMLDADGSSDAGGPSSPVSDRSTPCPTDIRADLLAAFDTLPVEPAFPASPSPPEPDATDEDPSTPRVSAPARSVRFAGVDDDLSDTDEGAAANDTEEQSSANEATGPVAATPTIAITTDDKVSVSDQRPPGDPPKLRRSMRTKRVATIEQDVVKPPAKVPDKNDAPAIASCSTAPSAPARSSRSGRAPVKEVGDKRTRTDTADTDDEADEPQETDELPKKKAKMKGKSHANDDLGPFRKGRGAGGSSKRGKKG
ncbi:hypothetical protein HDZ31DRAFT_63601 [Schizophyllum fasciatum]